MERTGTTIIRYKDTDEDGIWYIDIIDKNSIWEAWLSHDSYGISEMMFGSYAPSLDEFCYLVESNLPDYKRGYKEQYFD